jgi:flagellar basal body-associated protein FliL
MNVILLTVFLGLILVGMAIVFFFYARVTSEGSSPERDSLLPLEDEIEATKTPKK